jgi:hypothetical protein
VNNKLTPRLVFGYQPEQDPASIWRMAGPKVVGPAIRDLLTGKETQVAFAVCVHPNALCGGKHAAEIRDVFRLAYIALATQGCLRMCDPAFNPLGSGAYTIYLGNDVTEAVAVTTRLLYKQVDSKPKPPCVVFRIEPTEVTHEIAPVAGSC